MIMRGVSCALMLTETTVKPQSCKKCEQRKRYVCHVKRPRHNVKALGDLSANSKTTGNEHPRTGCQRVGLLPDAQQSHRAEPNPCSLREGIHRPVRKTGTERTRNNAQLGHEWKCADVMKPIEHQKARRSEGDVNQPSENQGRDYCEWLHDVV